MGYNFNGKVALVTGGANGIGRCMVKELISNGVQGVTVADINLTLGEKVVKEFGDKVIFIKTDVTNPVEFEDAFRKTISKYGRLDIVENNAGVLNEKQWEQTIGLNVNAVVRGTLLAIQYMRKDKGGNGGIVVNTASVLGLQTQASAPVYCGTKHFVVSFCRAMGTDFYYNKTEVKVLAICPGKTETILIDQALGLDGFDGLTEYLALQLNSLPSQDPSNVGRGLITAINQGENGSAWVAEMNKSAYEENAPKPTLL